MRRVAAADAPLDAAAVERDRHALDVQQRRADLQLEATGILAPGRIGPEFFLGADDVDAEFLLVQGLQGIGKRTTAVDVREH
jgi:hypothetical protein